MLKSVKWDTFPRDFIRIQIGFALFGLAIATLIRANLGTSPWVMLEVAISQITGLSPGTMSIITGFIILIIAIALKEHIGWGTLGNILFIGPWEDLALSFIPSITGNFWLQLTMLLLEPLG